VNLGTTTPPGTPTISTVSNPTSTSSTVTVQLPTPFTVTAGAAAGLKMDFDLRQSILTDSNGQVTGVVNPTIDFTALTPRGGPFASISLLLREVNECRESRLLS